MVNFSLHTIEPGIKINGNWIRLIDLIIEVVIIDNKHNKHKLMLHMQNSWCNFRVSMESLKLGP